MFCQYNTIQPCFVLSTVNFQYKHLQIGSLNLETVIYKPEQKYTFVHYFQKTATNVNSVNVCDTIVQKCGSVYLHLRLVLELLSYSCIIWSDPLAR